MTKDAVSAEVTASWCSVSGPLVQQGGSLGHEQAVDVCAVEAAGHGRAEPSEIL